MNIKQYCSNIAVTFLLVFSGASLAQETPRYNVVAEFIRELGDTKNLQDTANIEQAQTEKMEWVEKTQQAMSNAIRNSTLAALKLNQSNFILKNMTLGKPFDTLLPAMIAWNEQKIMLHTEISKIAKIFIGGPKPGVDYSAPVARMPEITAGMEFANESIFKLTPLIFATLIDDKPDSKNHLSHLIITKAEGKELADSINSYFGSSLNEKNQNWTVSAASVLRTYLTKNGYKFSDDPWE